jgi:transposase
MADGRDFRKLDMATQAELRRVPPFGRCLRPAVALVAAGKTRLEAAAVGVNRRYVGAWVAAAARSGVAALAGGRRGRRPGEQKALSPRQESRMRRRIAERCPDRLKLPFALWTREAVGALIARETGVELGLDGRPLPARLGLHRAAADAAGGRAA